MTSVIMPTPIRDYDIDLNSKLNTMNKPKIGEHIESRSDSSDEYLSQTDSDYFGSPRGDPYETPARITDFEPLFLEDSKISRGYIISLPCYRMSMNPYVNSKNLNEDLNRLWRRKYPFITNIQLSKIREEKYSVCECFLKQGEKDISALFIVAKSWVQFERLIMLNIVTESDAKMIYATCLII